VDASALPGVWIHAREEDDAERVVYRDPSHEFPPARAPRRTLTFNDDGSVVVGEPGPADAAEPVAGSWQLVDDRLTVALEDREEVYEVESLDDALVLRRRS
jgi:hypothetical protein